MNITKSTFSIIVPVYNAEQYLDKCIESILTQTYKNFELLLIDDGSTDSSGDICDKYSNTDVRVKVIHKNNAGVSVARNDGMEKAKGTYICFIDSDDWIESNYLERIQAEMETCDILFFGCVWHYEDGLTLSLCPPSSPCRKNIYRAIYRLLQNKSDLSYFGYTWNKVFRKDIIDMFAIRFVENLSIMEDEVFSLTYCNHAHSLKVISDPIYHYRWKEQGLMHKKKTSAECFLLAENFQALLTEIKDDKLVDAYHSRIATYYNLAAWSNDSLLGWMRNEWRMFKYCRMNNIPLPRKSIVVEFIKKIGRRYNG